MGNEEYWCSIYLTKGTTISSPEVEFWPETSTTINHAKLAGVSIVNELLPKLTAHWCANEEGADPCIKRKDDLIRTNYCLIPVRQPLVGWDGIDSSPLAVLALIQISCVATSLKHGCKNRSNTEKCFKKTQCWQVKQSLNVHISRFKKWRKICYADDRCINLAFSQRCRPVWVKRGCPYQASI